MPKLPDLLAISLDDVQPEVGRVGPRLWIRRLVIWRAQGDIIRDIELKPGLNVIWSPDSGKPNEPMGHGGGKTSFCRLIRYCLGEGAFGSATQRELIANRIPDGYVGAEVMLDGVQWAVVRPIGTGNRHYCAEGIAVEAAFSMDMPNIGIAPLREAITSALMAEAADRMPLVHPRHDAWEATLAWLSRDQECRLRDPLDWRAAQTQSRSPSRQRQLADTDRLVIVRLLLNALRAEETIAADAVRKARSEIEKSRERQRRLEWLVRDLRDGLSETFGGAESPTSQLAFWAEQAAAKLKATEGSTEHNLNARLRQVRHDAEIARTEVQTLGAKINVIDGRLTEKASLKSVLDNNRAKAHTHLVDAQNPVCKSCGQRLDQNAIDFIQERKAEAEDAAKALEGLLIDMGQLATEKQTLQYQKAAAEQTLAPIVAAISQLEVQSAKLAEAKGYMTMTARYALHADELERGSVALERLALHLTSEGQKVNELRRSSQEVINRLSQLFDASLRFLVPDNAQGQIALNEDGLQLSLHIGGERSTAAIDSLKIVAFDLAALLLTIEGRTQLPAFLIHDSPREADLGLSIYNRFFELGLRMEGLGPTPLFQYIVTTTTAPPKQFRTDQWVKLELRGAPREKRLFMEDL